MAKSASIPPVQNVVPPGGRVVAYDEYIEQQLDKTSGQVRGVDIAGSLMTLAAGIVGFFLVVALVDHWVIPGGLGFWGRLLACAALVSGACYFTAVEILPLALRRINPIYAAHTIEAGAPGLKNGLINFLQLKGNRQGLSEPVFQAIEAQAAAGLARVPAEATVDHSRLIKIGYALIGILLIAGLYAFLSPKDPLKTVGRVVFPWADIQAPTRVTILRVEPGATSVFHGTQVTVTMEVRGMPSSGQARLVYGTIDGHVVDQQIVMQPTDETFRYVCVLPESSAGLRQSVRYHVEAGDAHSPEYEITVLAAPTITVQSIDYEYPEYTGLAPYHVEHQGDIKGIEGARVTLHAVANQTIKRAVIDFECTGRDGKGMLVKEREATGEFVLALGDDHRAPQHASYQLLFTNDKGQDNPQPIAYRIEVTPDLPPEVEILSPKSAELDLPMGASVGVEVVANDPDFALRRVKLVASVGGQEVYGLMLLDEARPGQFNKKLRLSTKRLGVKPGDIVQYWAVAEDVKAPNPNRVESGHRRLRIVAADDRQQSGDQLARNDDDVRMDAPNKRQPNPGDESDANREDAADAGDSKQRSKNAGRNQPGDAGDKEDRANRDTADDQAGPSRSSEDSSDERQKPSAGKRRQRSDDEQRGGKQDAGRNDAESQPEMNQENADDASQQQSSGGSGGKQSSGGERSDQRTSGAQSGGGDSKNNSRSQSSGEKSGSGDQRGGSKSKDRSASESGDSASSGQQGDKRQAGGESSTGGEEGESQPVAKDGSDDGSAIERILKHQEEKERDQAGGGDRGGKSTDSKSGSSSSSSKPDGDQPERSKGDKSNGQSGQGGQDDKSDGGENPKSSDRSESGAGSGKQDQRSNGSAGDQQPQNGQGQGRKGDKSSEAKRGDDTGSAGEQRSSDERPNPLQRGQRGKPEAGAKRDRSQENAGSEKSEGGDPTGSGEKSAGKSDGQGGDAMKSGDRPDGEAGEPKGDDGQPGERPDATKSQGKTAGSGARKPGKPAAGQKPDEAGDAKPNADNAGDDVGERSATDETGVGRNAKQRSKGKPATKEQRPESNNDPATDSQQPNPAGKDADEHDPAAAQSENPDDRANGAGKHAGDRSGQGAKSKGDRGDKPRDLPKDAKQTPDAKGGDAENEKGDSGAGHSSKDPNGSVSPQGANQPRRKTESGGGHDPRNDQKGDSQPQSPSNSDKQSDSKGDDQSGSLSGGGGKGGGQKANKSGTGGAGQNTAADEGAGRGEGRGQGETGDKAGDDQQANHATGQAGKNRGAGSTSSRRPGIKGDGQSPPGSDANAEPEAGDKREPEAGDKREPGGKSKENPGGKQERPKKAGDDSATAKNERPGDAKGQKQTKPGQPAQQPSASQGEQGAANNPQGGQPGSESGPGGQNPNGGSAAGSTDAPAAPQAEESTPPEEANLNYARKATDMALERLKHQVEKGETDPALLDKLGWSRDDLEKFMNRWERMRREAAQSGPEGATARRELDDTLRSLGLRPRNTNLRSGRVQDDRAHGLKESRRSQPPAEYAEQYKAYTEGASRGGGK